ncbi:Hypothetical protein Nlim_1991 [Candidatus Nitrosarchaeum limnium SFB1]|jgi:glycerophosphoryl diester phosphodiesterase|uniref:Glycerophosphoryl diester phosphodiesterase n=1 Tax=Candidatus Nitrosarchaeum limnium SFB1 TaxID=886738 RepID=F3KMV1_9ARCH|nr:Hypothetical protein Nlim_1991 [Candidatus Nitrosarchaeum limnium SFB1]
MLEIFGHRAIFNGVENSVKSIPYYKKLGVGIELDLRHNKKGVYISHDPTNDGDLFEDMCKICSDLEIRMALHIKEIEIINEVIRLLEKYSITNYFIFNTENFEYPEFVDKKKIAAYISKKQENIKEDILWCDEIQKKWYSQKTISDLHQKNKVVYVMSLEVVKTCQEKEVLLEWQRLINLGIDGICTKYPEKLMRFVKGDLN